MVGLTKHNPTSTTYYEFPNRPPPPNTRTGKFQCRDWRPEYLRHSRISAVFLCLALSCLLWRAGRSSRKAGQKRGQVLQKHTLGILVLMQDLTPTISRAAYPTFFCYISVFRLCYRRFLLLYCGNGTTRPDSLYGYLPRFPTHYHLRMPPTLAVSDRCNGFSGQSSSWYLDSA